jgi:4'-phosphopantetheinyl transferase
MGTDKDRRLTTDRGVCPGRSSVISNTHMTAPIPPLSQRPEPDALLSFRRPGPGYRLAFVSIPALLQTVLKVAVGSAFRTAPARVFTPRDFHEPFLGPNELDLLNGFKALKKQVEWMAGRYAAKQLAGQFLPHQPSLSRTQVAYRPKGAPHFSDDPTLSLSISHSGNFAVAGMGLRPACILGVDLEMIRPESRSTLLRTAFSAREVRVLEHQDDATLFRCWTSKEAYLKYIGLGFHESLKRVEILNDSLFHDGHPVPSLSLATHLPFPGYAFAMVS